jgi:large subunit ribosomal protein L9
MDVILLERVAKLGQMGEVVSVKDGYARNFLLPQKKALRANEANIKAFEDRRRHSSRRATSKPRKRPRHWPPSSTAAVRHHPLGLRRGALYGSVTTRDAADAATEDGFTLDRKQVALSRPIKELGLHTVHVNLHPEVDVDIVLNVARSPEEAELQASGKSIQELAAEEEAAAEFEIAELFDDIGAAQLDDGAPPRTTRKTDLPVDPPRSRNREQIGRIPCRDAAYLFSSTPRSPRTPCQTVPCSSPPAALLLTLTAPRPLPNRFPTGSRTAPTSSPPSPDRPKRRNASRPSSRTRSSSPAGWSTPGPWRSCPMARASS